jgi:hypothetical protein
MLTTARDRMAAATGALFVVLIMIGNQISMSGATQSTHPSGAAVLRDAARQAASTSATVGFVLEFLGFLAFMAFLGYLLDARRRTAGPGVNTFAAGTAVLAGLTMLIVKLASVAPAGALLMDRSTLSPETAQALNDMNGVSFVLSWLPFAVFVGAAAVGLYRSTLVGRPTMIIGAVIGTVGLALALLGLQDPLGGGNPIGWLLGLLWTLVVSVRLAVRPGTRPVVAEEGSTAAVPVQV